MLEGDNWIGDIVSAIENVPQWNSTAIFITYDDCGCFYDPVTPPNGWGVRVPMLVVSPYARAGFTDTTPTTYAGVLAFIEHALSLQPLSDADQRAYDNPSERYADSFDYQQKP